MMDDFRMTESKLIFAIFNVKMALTPFSHGSLILHVLYGGNSPII